MYNYDVAFNVKPLLNIFSPNNIIVRVSAVIKVNNPIFIPDDRLKKQISKIVG
jgi:hypothetical protein